MVGIDLSSQEIPRSRGPYKFTVFVPWCKTAGVLDLSPYGQPYPHTKSRIGA